MKINNIAIIALSLLVPLTIQAQKQQKKNAVVKKPPVVVVEEPQEDPRIIEMREATQQIIFIDSVGVAKNDFRIYVLTQLTLMHGLDAANSANRHKDRCRYYAVVSMQNAGTGIGKPVGGIKFEIEVGIWKIVWHVKYIIKL